MKKVLVVFCMIFSFAAFSQRELPVFTKAEIAPVYSGGITSFQNWLKLQNASEKNLNIRFIIEINGSISNVEILSNLDEKRKNEIIRILNESPKWTPANQNGKDVRFQMVMHLQ
jgi:hypothetical protein